MKKGTIIVLAVLMAALLVPQAGAISIGKTAIAVSVNDAWACGAGDRASSFALTAEKTSVSVAPEDQDQLSNGVKPSSRNSRGCYGSRCPPATAPTTASTQGVAVASATGCIAESSARSIGVSAATNGVCL